MAENKKSEIDMSNINYPPMGQCVPQEMVIQDVKLAAAYVPFQKFCTRFSPMEGLRHGTIFPELFSPYKKMDKKYKHDWKE